MTWNIGDNARHRAREIAALQLGIDLGMTLIDTAEMYGEGASEELIGEAIRGRRSQVFLVSKVYPHNATRKGAVAACERSLRRLGVESLDLYLLHWRGSVPLGETLEVFAELKRAGKIAAFGVSNFDTPDIGPFFGWLSNNISLYDRSTWAMKTMARFQGNGKRPLIELEPCDHPLYLDYSQGITLERAPAVIAAGAASVAVIGDLLSTGDPEARVRQYLERLRNLSPRAES